MIITNYQIHNVLKVYSSQLSRKSSAAESKPVDTRSAVDNITISIEGRRQSIIEQVAGDIVDRITRHGPQQEMDRQIINQLEDEMNGNAAFDSPNGAQFRYNVIDRQQGKTTRTVTMEDSNFLLNRLEQIAREAVGNTIEVTRLKPEG